MEIVIYGVCVWFCNWCYGLSMIMSLVVGVGLYLGLKELFSFIERHRSKRSKQCKDLLKRVEKIERRIKNQKGYVLDGFNLSLCFQELLMESETYCMSTGNYVSANQVLLPRLLNKIKRNPSKWVEFFQVINRP